MWVRILITPQIPRAQRQRSPEKADPKDPQPQKPSKDDGQADSVPKITAKAPTPSSSRPAPPHPILKKGRGPSTSGTRPTARFVSPPASEMEDDARPDDVSSGSTAVSASEMPAPPLPASGKREKAPASKATGSRGDMPPPPLPVSSKKEGKAKAAEAAMRPPSTHSPGRSDKCSSSTRRIVASTAASKRRPSMPRRQSSQSSASSITSSSSNIPKQLTPSNVVHQPERGSHSSSGSSSQASLLLMGSKAAGKRPARSWSKRSASQSDSSQGGSSQERFRPPATPPQRQAVPAIRQAAIASPRTPSVAGFVGNPQLETIVPRVERSISLVEGPRRSRDSIIGAPVAQALVSTSVVATSNTIARGRFDSETIPTPAVVAEARDIPDSLLPAGGAAYPGPLTGQFTPTPPNPAPPVPFGRSMSQLTLLLERERSRKN